MYKRQVDLEIDPDDNEEWEEELGAGGHDGVHHFGVAHPSVLAHEDVRHQPHVFHLDQFMQLDEKQFRGELNDGLIISSEPLNSRLALGLHTFFVHVGNFRYK